MKQCKSSNNFLSKKSKIHPTDFVSGFLLLQNKYFVSILVDDSKKIPEKPNLSDDNAIGVDVGLTHFATLSTGEKIKNPRFLKKKIRQLKIAQRRASRKKKGSANRKKANLKVAKIHEKIANARRDFLHKLTSKLVGENQAIIVEDLKIKDMMQNSYLAQSIGDVSWSEFIRQLEYKAEWYGVHLIKVDPKNTSKTCSNCGYINKNLRLEHRCWECPVCDTEHDRDVNAAKNILRRGTAEVKPVERTGLPDAVKQEVGDRHSE